MLKVAIPLTIGKLYDAAGDVKDRIKEKFSSGKDDSEEKNSSHDSQRLGSNNAGPGPGQIHDVSGSSMGHSHIGGSGGQGSTQYSGQALGSNTAMDTFQGTSAAELGRGQSSGSSRLSGQSRGSSDTSSSDSDLGHGLGGSKLTAMDTSQLSSGSDQDPRGAAQRLGGSGHGLSEGNIAGLTGKEAADHLEIAQEQIGRAKHKVSQGKIGK